MTEKDYGLVRDVEELRSIVDKIIEDGKPFGFDIETGYSGPDKAKAQFHPEEGFVVGLSLTNSNNWARYVPFAHDFNDANVDPALCAPILWKLLSTGLGIAHNAKFEYHFMTAFFRNFLPGVENCGHFDFHSDTMLQAYATGDYQRVGLKHLVDVVFKHKMTQFKDLFPENSKQKEDTFRFNVLELSDKAVSYACEDSLWCLSLYYHFESILESAKKLPGKYGSINSIYDLEMKILPILCQMEKTGLKVDWKFLIDAADAAREFQSALYDEIMLNLSEALGRSVVVNLNSPDQVRSLLYDDLELEGTRFTKGSKNTDSPVLSTDAQALEKLSRKHKVVKKILQWREIKKLIGSYLEKFPSQYAYDTELDVAHCSHNQALVITGRFSVSDFNYQQLPKHYHYELDDGLIFDLNFRDCIISPEGFYIAGFDLSQVELRVLAGESKEPVWLQAFSEGADIHARTASLVLGKPESELTDKERDGAGKGTNFSIGYGQGPEALSDSLAISFDAAEELHQNYFNSVPKLRDYIEEQHQIGRKAGFVTTRFGRKCTVWEFLSKNRYEISKGDRASLNYQIQGAGTGDLPKLLMVNINNHLKSLGLLDKIKLVMNVHDELNFYVSNEVSFEQFVSIIKIPLQALDSKLTDWPQIEVEWHKGERWGTLQEYVNMPDGSIMEKSKYKALKRSLDSQVVATDSSRVVLKVNRPMLTSDWSVLEQFRKTTGSVEVVLRLDSEDLCLGSNLRWDAAVQKILISQIAGMEIL